MDTQKKKLLIAAGALVLLAAVLLGVWMFTHPAAVQGAKTVTVEVVHADGSEKTFTYHTDEEYLAGVLLAEGLVEGEEGLYGLFITSVDGEQADFDTDGAYWAVLQDGEYAMTGVSELPVHDGDTFGLVYTIGE